MADADDNENRPFNRSSTTNVRFRRSESSSSTGSSAQGDDSFYHRGSADKDTDWRTSRHRSSSSMAQSTGVRGRSGNWRDHERSRSDWRDRQSSSGQYHDYHRPLGNDVTDRKRPDEHRQAECNQAAELKSLKYSSSSTEQLHQRTWKSASRQVSKPVVVSTRARIQHSSASLPVIARGCKNANWQGNKSTLPSDGAGKNGGNYNQRNSVGKDTNAASMLETGMVVPRRPQNGPSDGQDCKATEKKNFLERLLALANVEPTDAVICLESPRNGLLKYFKFPEIKDTRLLEGLVKALHTACQSNYSPCALNSLLEKVLDSGFLTGPLFHYLTSTDGDAVFVANVAFICKTFLYHLPSFSLSAVTLLQSQLIRWGKQKKEISKYGMTVNGLNQWKAGENNNLPVNIESACLAIAETEEMHKDVVKQIKRGDVVRDQETANKGDIEQPPDDFRKIPLIPTQAEINSSEPPFLRKNIIYGAYRDVDHYLDVQYRLLREDFVCPLREGLKVLKQRRAENIPLGRLSDVHFYREVRIMSSNCSNDCVIYEAKFDVLQFRRVDWTKSKRLKGGSLVALSQDNFRHIVFGTLVNRNVKDIQKGVIYICFDDTNTSALDCNPYKKYEMIECSAYFESYRYVLQGLQEIQPGYLPFQKLLLNQTNSEDVSIPQYLTREVNTCYDFSCLLKSHRSDTYIAKTIPVLDTEAWPSMTELRLDASQYSALKTAVTKEFVAIQGPPGTGKTFIGLKIVQLLLHNCEQWNYDGSPILIVCYTNHALDQFLEGIIQICHPEPNQLVRVGGRSSSKDPYLMKCNLNRLRQRASDNVRNARFDVIDNMGRIAKEIAQLTAVLECAREYIIHENHLWLYMTHEQKNSLTNDSRLQLGTECKPSLLLPWLQPDDFEAGNDDNIVNDEEDIPDATDDTLMENELDSDERDFRKESKQNLNSKSAKDACQQRMCIFKEVDCSLDGSKSANHSVQRVAYRKCHNRIMSDEECNAVRDVWQLSVDDRWRLYNHWASDLCEEQSIHIQTQHRKYSIQAGIKMEYDSERDVDILRQARVIGMTTTCAAKNRRIIQRVHPKIVIVEEAAEVLEAHIVTTLSARCEHLIMIGDHQQLRPNPTVYKLAKQYHLDISLFERMVKNDLHCDRLTIQHRMRPEIVKLIVPHIYKSLDNHESVLDYEHVAGIASNVFFVKHKEEESSVDDSKSHSNLYEARFLTALCHYLLQQGYKPSQITVLTMYTGQMFLLKSLIKPLSDDEVHVTPVDNFQGEENDIILLSLVRSNEEGKIGFLQIHNRVCVALSRARMGLYVVGNMDVLAGASSLWCGIGKQLEGDGRLATALPLGCQFHVDSDKTVFAQSPDDFDKAPRGKCQLECGFKHECGHVCEKKCHAADRQHVGQYRCDKPCTKILCKNGHTCPKWCGDECDPCNVLVEKVMPFCDHLQTMKCCVDPVEFICQMPCETLLPECGHHCQNVCGIKCTTECSVIVPDREWPCGHLHSVECYKNPDNLKCDVMIEKQLDCGHSVTVKCFEKSEEFTCQKPCDKLLNCGHQCQKICSKQCTTQCSVIMPDREWPCGHLLSIECYNTPDNFTCVVSIQKELDCGHSITVKCCDKSTKIPCEKPCEKLLRCGHQCQNLCSKQCTRKCLVVVADREWPCGHKLTKECQYNSDSFSCDVVIEKKLPCGHVASMKCGFTSYQCKETVKYTRCRDKTHIYETICHQVKSDRWEKCDKPVNVTCSYNPNHAYITRCCDRDKRLCSVPCRVPLPCGHQCSGTCSQCINGHADCRAIDTELLPCQHFCKVGCGSRLPKCYNTCISHCGHRPCRNVCSDVCDKCPLLCCWSCPHERCDLRCYEPCTRAACNKPCPERLYCGHRCIGLCGEPCPPFCTTCNPKIISNVVNYLKLTNYSKRLTRFVYLEPCRHIIEVNYMDQWVERSRVDVLQPVTCPVCKMIVGHCPRYNSEIKQYTIRCNELKQASTVTKQLAVRAKFAIEFFAPDDVDSVMQVLLEDPRPDDDVFKSEIDRMMNIRLEDTPTGDDLAKDRLLEAKLSFQSLSLGAICVWHQCWGLLQLVKKEGPRDHLDIKEIEQSLRVMKTALREQILTTAYLSVLTDIEKLQTSFIVLNVHHMLTFITNQQLRSILNNLLASKSKYVGARSWAILANNYYLKTKFTIRHRNDIEDYLEHLNLFFQPVLRDQLKGKPHNDGLYVRVSRDRILRPQDPSEPQVTVKITDIIQDVLHPPTDERQTPAAAAAAVVAKKNF